MHAQLLAKPDGTGRRKATAAPLTDVEGESAAGGVHEGTGGGGDAEESTWTEDTWKLEQAQLSGTCAKMVMACVRHRYDCGTDRWSTEQNPNPLVGCSDMLRNLTMYKAVIASVCVCPCAAVGHLL